MRRCCRLDRRCPTVLNWTDGTPVDYTAPAFWGNPQNEIGYRVERSDDGITFSVIGRRSPTNITFTDTTAVLSQPYSYRVIAHNAAGDSVSNVMVVKATPVVTCGCAPTDLLGNSTQRRAVECDRIGTRLIRLHTSRCHSLNCRNLHTVCPLHSDRYCQLQHSNGQVPLVVGQSVPVITWPTPAPISYGTALSGVQLNATASVPGTFAYTPDIGVVLNAEATLFRSPSLRPTPPTTPLPRLA